MNSDIISDHVTWIRASVLAGILFDILLGDPVYLPHPVRLFGKAIAGMERRFNMGSNRRLKGVFIWLVLVTSTGCIFCFTDHILMSFGLWYYIFCSLFFFYGISTRSLIEEALKVEHKLKKNDIVGARKQLSKIVGRDTALLTTQRIRSAILETLSENLSDGIVAPLFYFFLGGIPAMMMYKMVNTLDSMVGYKNERYSRFGWFSARMDDAANLLPSRLTAALMALVTFCPRSFVYILRYGHNHSSPNSGYPEAALAGILNCRLGGPSLYQGVMVHKPYIGLNKREISKNDIIKSCCVNLLVAVTAYLIILVFYS